MKRGGTRDITAIQVKKNLDVDIVHQPNQTPSNNGKFKAFILIPSLSKGEDYGFIWLYGSAKTFGNGGKLPFPAGGSTTKYFKEVRFNNHQATTTDWRKQSFTFTSGNFDKALLALRWLNATTDWRSPGTPKVKNPYYYRNMRPIWDAMPKEFVPFIFDPFPFESIHKVNLPHEQIKTLIRVEWELYEDIIKGHIKVPGAEFISKKI